ncbi:MAG: ribosomal protein S18-alanine N-acetyltransferase [Lachnospira sp.]|jgi:ribosomal-protein-alanine N-acetyltransferase|nr:ribosomal protein S18-alanine N-acetyltransferase [Lachnospira sp.]
MSEHTFAIRKMEEKDISSVESIEKRVFSIPWSEKSFLDACMTPENIYLVAETEDGSIAGYCGLWTVLGEGNITNMAVAETYRKCGVGRKLMEAMEQEGRRMDVSIFFLEVRESNEAARHLYDSMGYTNIGTRKRFYERPVEDAIVMSKIYQ